MIVSIDGQTIVSWTVDTDWFKDSSFEDILSIYGPGYPVDVILAQVEDLLPESSLRIIMPSLLLPCPA